MKNKNKLKNLGFTSGHAQVLTVAVAVFAVLMFAKSDLNLRALFANADNDAQMVTYEDVLAQVRSEYGGVSPVDDTEAKEQIALLDRSEDGKVLGEAIGLGAIPSADQMYSEENLATIPVAKIISTTESNVNIYFANMKLIEAQNNADEIFGNLNSSDSVALKQAKVSALSIVEKMKTIEVPSELEKYHKYTILYYSSISLIADGFIDNSFGQNFKEASKSMLSLTDKLTAMKQELSTKYNVVF